MPIKTKEQATVVKLIHSLLELSYSEMLAIETDEIGKEIEKLEEDETKNAAKIKELQSKMAKVNEENGDKLEKFTAEVTGLTADKLGGDIENTVKILDTVSSIVSKKLEARLKDAQNYEGPIFEGKDDETPETHKARADECEKIIDSILEETAKKDDLKLDDDVLAKIKSWRRTTDAAKAQADGGSELKETAKKAVTDITTTLIDETALTAKHFATRFTADMLRSPHIKDFAALTTAVDEISKRGSGPEQEELIKNYIKAYSEKYNISAAVAEELDKMSLTPDDEHISLSDCLDTVLKASEAQVTAETESKRQADEMKAMYSITAVNRDINASVAISKPAFATTELHNQNRYSALCDKFHFILKACAFDKADLTNLGLPALKKDESPEQYANRVTEDSPTLLKTLAGVTSSSEQLADLDISKMAAKAKEINSARASAPKYGSIERYKTFCTTFYEDHSRLILTGASALATIGMVVAIVKNRERIEEAGSILSSSAIEGGSKAVKATGKFALETTKSAVQEHASKAAVPAAAAAGAAGVSGVKKLFGWLRGDKPADATPSSGDSPKPNSDDTTPNP